MSTGGRGCGIICKGSARINYPHSTGPEVVYTSSGGFVVTGVRMYDGISVSGQGR